MSTTLTISNEGAVSCLYTELIDLTSLGRLEVQRASTIEFNNSTQQWEVKVGDQIPFSHASRTMCLEWEHENL